MVKANGVIPKSEQQRILHEVWNRTLEDGQIEFADAVADVGAWLIKSMREDSPVRVLTIMACLGYALDSEGHVVERNS